MRKRTIHNILDSLFYWFLAILPLVSYCLYSYQNTQPMLFTDYIVDIFELPFQGITFEIATWLSQNVDNILSIDTINAWLAVVGYYISINILHLMVDLILFVPNLARKWLNRSLGGVLNE